MSDLETIQYLKTRHEKLCCVLNIAQKGVVGSEACLRSSRTEKLCSSSKDMSGILQVVHAYPDYTHLSWGSSSRVAALHSATLWQRRVLESWALVARPCEFSNRAIVYRLMFLMYRRVSRHTTPRAPLVGVLQDVRSMLLVSQLKLPSRSYRAIGVSQLYCRKSQFETPLSPEPYYFWKQVLTPMLFLPLDPRNW